jgi:hypothetical protein
MAARRWCVVGPHKKVAMEAAVGGEQSGRMVRAGTLRNASNSNQSLSLYTLPQVRQ